MNGNSVRIPVALVGVIVLLVVQLVVVAFMFGEVRAELQSNGDRLVRIEGLLDTPPAVRNP